MAQQMAMQHRSLFDGVEDATLFLPGLTVGRLLNTALAFFFLRLLVAIVAHRQMLQPRYGRTHRVVGMILLLYLVAGLIDARAIGPFIPPHLVGIYDAGISALGFATACSAALEFGSERVHQRGSEASGILDEKAVVSHSEMVEHCFYQLLNLCQIGFLYAVAALQQHRVKAHGERALAGADVARIALAIGMLLPWLARGRFPVNAFSANYKKPGVGGATPLIRFLYRMKKWQYLLYKHGLLHGLNASVAVGRCMPHAAPCPPPLVVTAHFRLYWLCLNTAYVNEFFMQTLVRRRYMSQRWMLLLQQTLMLVSTAAAGQVLQAVRPLPAALSFALNFVRRGREVSNGCVVIAVALAHEHFAS
jgi:hypothetical protein